MKKILSLIFFVFGAIAVGAQNFHFLSDRHVMMSMVATQHYILLPVEEKAEIANIGMVVGNKNEQNLNVRLAVEHIDYFVPVDVSGFKGKTVLMNIKLNANQRVNGVIKDYICWKGIEQSDSYNTSNREKFRPLYHHTPLYGWMNDPNGMFYYHGTWHLYYQRNPYGSQWENMTWGHSTSQDLIHWTAQQDAISPDALGAIFSGSCVVDKNNTAGFGKDAIVAYYTSAGDNQTQSMAYSTDGGMTFTKYAANPVITSDIPDFRDPHLFWNEDINKWNLILAAGQEMYIYSSPNLKDWTFESSFGKGYGCHGGVWECPDLMKLNVRGTDKQKWLLVCNINPGGPSGGSATQYFVGRFDGHKFVCESQPNVTKWMDYGKDHYAAVTFDNAPDGRHVIMGWMSNWQYAGQVPTMQFRSANTIARDVDLYEYKGSTYVGLKPAKEMDAARGKEIVKNTSSRMKKFNTADGTYEMIVDFISSNKILLTLTNAKGEQVVITCDPVCGKLMMDRIKSGITTFNESFPAVTTAPTNGPVKQLRIFVDRSSIEIFDGEGHVSMTNLVFPTQPYNIMKIDGGKQCKTSVSIYQLNNK